MQSDADRLRGRAVHGCGSAGRVTGKVVIVTGAARGQGATEAHALAKEGATVVATDIVSPAELAPGALDGRGAAIVYRQLDVTDPAVWARLGAELRVRYGQVHGLVNNAGLAQDSPGHRKIRKRSLLSDSSLLIPTTGSVTNVTETETVVNRLDRRKARTRAALVAAARELLASRDPGEVSIQEITDMADVGFGSFYNHFESKGELFDAALEEVLEEHGAMFDALTADIDDPAEVYASSVRMTVRMAKTHPQIARIMIRTGLRLLNTPGGLAPRGLRDLERAQRAGRIQIGDPKVALASSGGAVLGVLALTATMPRTKAIAAAADELAANLLRMFGLPDAEAREIASRPLPEHRL